AFLATEAASSLGLYFSKSVTFERFGALTGDVFIKGLIAGSSLMFGAFIAKRFVLHMKPDVFSGDGRDHGRGRAHHAMERHAILLSTDSPHPWPNPPFPSSARTAARPITAGRASARPAASGTRWPKKTRAAACRYRSAPSARGGPLRWRVLPEKARTPLAC